MDNVIEVNGLNKSYKDFGLNNINLSLPKGTIMGLIGENGSGKTTIIKSILNTINMDSGSIKIFGKENNDANLDIRERIGVVFGTIGFNEELTANDCFSILSKIHKNWDENLKNKYLKTFKIPVDKPIKELSKGTKMKLSITNALSHNPDLLILDEPTDGLDPIIRMEFLDILLDFIQDSEKSVLFTSHITSDIEKIADNITLINNGQIVFTKDKNKLMYDYGIIRTTEELFDDIDKKDVVYYTRNNFGWTFLVEDINLAKKTYTETENLVIDRPTIEEVMFLYIKGEK